MTPPGEPSGPDKLRDQVQTQHPEISQEIEGAIRTLRKLQHITGTIGIERSADLPAGDLSATTEATRSPPSGAGEDDAEFDLKTDADPGPSGDVPLLTAGESFGRYQITRMLGRGAMGAVYLAYDSQLQRFVALKTPFLANTPRIIKRFYREARAAAQIRSPYTCPIYDVDQISGIHYLSMAFIDGRPLTRLIKDGQLIKDLPRIANIVRKIARGIQKAHELTIIHRDLKPDNIMIDNDGEPIVMDFGLARRIDDDIKVSTPGYILGTPAYMSPEQAEGDPKKIGLATDIYSLGVVLYEMLTGRLPFEGSFVSMLRRIASEAPPKPSALVPELGLDSPLERVCLKMLAKSPADRYPSMAAVAEALEELTSARPAQAARKSLFARIRSWWRKRPSSPTPAKEPAATPVADAVPVPAEAAVEPTLGDSQPDKQITPSALLSDTQTVDLAPVQVSASSISELATCDVNPAASGDSGAHAQSATDATHQD